MSFQLQIFSDRTGRYHRSSTYDTPDAAREDAGRGIMRAYRIVNTEREKELPMKPRFRKRSIRRSTLDSIDIKHQAERAAAFYRQRGPGPVWVFPAGGTGHSCDFRYYLALHLADKPGREWGDDWNARRRRNEALCADEGFPFVEVDPEDYR